MKNNHYELFSVEKKVIIVTGGAGYLGSEYALSLAEAGAQVVVWDTETAISGQKMSSKGIVARAVDITNEKEVIEAVAEVVKNFGKIDTLINNAALNAKASSTESAGQFAPYEDYPIDLWEKELKVNLTGTMITTKAVASVMIRQKYGSIVNVASELSVIAHDHHIYGVTDDIRFKSIAYTTTKSALVGFSRQWAARLGKYNVRVNTFSPSGVQKASQSKDFVERYSATTMFGRMARHDEYNGAIAFLCSDASAFMTGHNLIVDGGRTAW